MLYQTSRLQKGSTSEISERLYKKRKTEINGHIHLPLSTQRDNTDLTILKSKKQNEE